MSEVLFILTTIYVAYVVYKVADDQRVEMQANRARAAGSVLTPSGFTTGTEVPESPVKVAAAEPVVEAAPVVAEKVAEVAATPVSRSELRHPETGEVAKVNNNYRGLKRWLKEALVEEGLLGKVYSTSELNDDVNAKIKQALETIKTMSKYHA